MTENGIRRRVALVRASSFVAIVAGAAVVAGAYGAPGSTDARGRPSSRWTEPRTGMSFVLIPAGSFEMGSAGDEPGREPGELRHRVHLSRPFYLGQYEVTQSQWQAVMGENPSAFPSCGPRCPVERVSWNDVQAFLARLNRSTSAPALRLPTEAEWEYGCRAGTSTPYSTGASLSSSQANFDARFPPPGSPPGTYRGRPSPVGSFAPNAWGLYDMHGNVWEWTADPFCPYSSNDVTDPRPSCAAELKVIRGGSWYFDGNSCRCALRYTHRPADSGFSLGFRLARSVD